VLSVPLPVTLSESLKSGKSEKISVRQKDRRWRGSTARRGTLQAAGGEGIFAEHPKEGQEGSLPDEFEARLREAIIGEIEQRAIVIADYDPAWPRRFGREEARIRTALGPTALAVEHVGSTSVPGLAAKPIVDILLVVEDSGDEDTYLPALEKAGYVLRVREPDFDEHRMCRTPEKDVHVHIFSSRSREVARMLLLRDHLRSDQRDRELYASTKRGLASKNWPTMQHYADAKTGIIEDILARASGVSREQR
jgi:GrpB-like predicted nucleotidyltransferase (UPF0157 family)